MPCMSSMPKNFLWRPPSWPMESYCLLDVFCFFLQMSTVLLLASCILAPISLGAYSTSSKLPLHSSKTSFGINLACKILADLLPFNHFSLGFSDTKTAHSTHPPIQNQSEATATNRLRDTPYLLAGIKNRVQNTGFGFFVVVLSCTTVRNLPFKVFFGGDWNSGCF